LHAILETALTHLRYSNSFTFLLSSSIFLSNLGGTVDNSEKYANHISSSILFSGLSNF
jgi:hypothetical protein